MIKTILLAPPIAFLIYLVVAGAFSWLTRRIAAKSVMTPGKDDPYACGEEFPAEKLAPEYGKFFPFAIFFTIAHVAGLMLATLATAPQDAAYVFGAAYLLVVAVVMAVIFGSTGGESGGAMR